MGRLANAVEARERDLCAAVYDDLHKSAYDAFASEIGLVLGEVSHAIRHVRSWAKARRRGTPWLVWPARGEVHVEPYGVSLIVAPWNYPVLLTLLPLVGAIAAGNCAVLKPSELAPRTAKVLAELIAGAFPAEYVAIVEGGRDVAEQLLGERFDKIFFTGGATVGRAVLAAAAKHLTPVTLELGGKSPCIVCADAPIDVTARRIAWGKFMNAGQTCVAPDYLLVDRRVARPLVDAIRAAVRSFYGDDPRASPSYGRIVSRAHVRRLAAYLADGRVVCGGAVDADDLYVAPTILADVSLDSPVMREEVFGPVLPVVEFDGIDDALRIVRDRPTPLALYLFTGDRAIERRVLATARSGGVCVNDTVSHMLGHDLPFGGLGESGTGAYHGKAGFDCFSHQRSVLRRSLHFDPPLRYPPPRSSLATLKRAYRFLVGA